MRLIDADQMAVDESEAYMSAQVQGTDDLNWLVNFAAHSKIQRLIADTPTVDAVPVVRCEGCKHARKSEDAFDWDGVTPLCECNYSRQPNRWHEYCSYGERKAGDGDA